MGLIFIAFAFVAFIISLIQIRRRQQATVKRIFSFFSLGLLGLYCVLMLSVLVVFSFSGIGSQELLVGPILGVVTLVLILSSPKKEKSSI